MDILQQLGLSQHNVGTCTGNGDWLQHEQQPHIDSINPADTKIIASVAVSSYDDYLAVAQASLDAWHNWRQVPAPQRGELVRQIAQLLRQHKDPLGSLVSMESGKLKQEGDGEVQEMIDIADFAVGQSRMLYGKSMHSERPQHRMYEQWHPLGPVGIISAFNFPVAVWAWNAFIAAICGDTVIWKPSAKTPLSAIAVQHLCNQAMQQTGFDNIFSLFIPDDNSVAEHFVNDARIPLISFTGSSTVGQRVGEQVAARMGRSLLELSGNNAIIVDESADLDLVVPSVLFGLVGTTGQRCTSTRRLIVHHRLLQPLTTCLQHALRQVRIGNPLDATTLMGPLIDQAAVETYQNAIAEIQQQGGEILFGGHVLQQAGYFVEPTLVAAQNNWPIVQRETFAPILYLMEFETLQQAIELQNAVPQGLSSALFTNDVRHAEQYLSAMGSDCGIANINIGTSGAEIGGAFGGEKQTGGGREAGSDCWKTYMRRQTNTINWSTELPLAQGIEFDINL